MRRVKVRTTTLEAFRRVLCTEYGSEIDLINSLKGQPSPPNALMCAGTEFHGLLASEAANVVRYGRDHKAEASRQFSFDGEQVLAARRHVGEGLCEVYGEKTFDVAGRPVKVTGHVDWIYGLMVQDHKCKFSTPDAKDYEPSVQWRFYLSLFEANVFRYNLFHFSDPSPENYCHLKETVSFRFWRYDGMEAECIQWLARFLDWLDSRRLTGCLTA